MEEGDQVGKGLCGDAEVGELECDKRLGDVGFVFLNPFYHEDLLDVRLIYLSSIIRISREDGVHHCIFRQCPITK